VCEEPGCDRYKYDLFVSYSGADRAWVEGYLIDALAQAGIRWHSEAAFPLGASRLIECERAIRQSRRTLLVLSPGYMADDADQFIDLLAQTYGQETRTWPVIPLTVRPVKLPSRLAMLVALDATDEAGWPSAMARLCDTARHPAPEQPKPQCPYPGMIPFDEADSDHFFGRDQEVRDLLMQLRLHPFLIVIGPSGSGKSSLVAAGLIPALRQSELFGTGRWEVRKMRPGEAPLRELEAVLGSDLADPASMIAATLDGERDLHRLLLVVDQFEETFARAPHAAAPFLDALLRLVQPARCYVVLTVRADFFPQLMAVGKPLWDRIKGHRAEVVPLDEEHVRQAIVRPAETAGVYLDPVLVDRLVGDATGEPGVLPFVQDTLVLLWEQLQRRYLPLTAYEALPRSYGAPGGPTRTGLQAVMSYRADAAIAELSEVERTIARRVFLRLVQFGEGRPDTRRQQKAADLRLGNDDAVVDHVVRHLAAARLLALSGGEGDMDHSVDIAHEALIIRWPTLRAWVSEKGEAEQTRRQLETKVLEWTQQHRGLLDSIELGIAERWLASPDAAELGSDKWGELPTMVTASRAAIIARKGTHSLRDLIVALQGENAAIEGEMKPLRERLMLLREQGAACPVCQKPMSNDERGRLSAEFRAEGVIKSAHLKANLAKIVLGKNMLHSVKIYDMRAKPLLLGRERDAGRAGRRQRRA